MYTSHMKILITLLLGITLLYSEGFKLSSVVQTGTQNTIQNYLEDLNALSLALHTKLNKRNPSQFDPKSQKAIVYAMENSVDIDYPSGNNNYLTILNKAFDPSLATNNRNDLLIIGLHKMFYTVFSQDDFKITALSYDKEAIEALYKNLQLLFWKLKTKKNGQGDYLFLTWQSDFQISVHEALKSKQSYAKTIQSLEALEHAQDDHAIFYAPNTSFSAIEAQMLYIVKKIIILRGGEPSDMGLDLLKSIAFMPLL